ncbi:MAG TPA: hypothetical protein VMV49_14970 [Candidatus Deferrimicrobium sp.]|nr:hypothetical protein [Candidatus Deferrimicrobium sp.]
MAYRTIYQKAAEAVRRPCRTVPQDAARSLYAVHKVREPPAGAGGAAPPVSGVVGPIFPAPPAPVASDRVSGPEGSCRLQETESCATRDFN